MRPYTISLMEKKDIPESARVLSVAMLENPLHAAIFQGCDERVRLEIEKMFGQLFTELPGTVLLAKDGPAIVGVMRMRSCDGRKVPAAPEGPRAENDVRWRKFIWRKEWARRDPKDPHWHLGPIGVLPSCQGAGVGSALMRRFCAEADAYSAKGYLETDLEKNVRFYAKFRFKVVSTATILQVKNHFMVRAALAAK